MLQITRQTEYAIRGLMELARRQSEVPVQLKSIASSCEVSEAFLAKIFQVLSQRQIVRSHRGVKGGFSLGRSPQQITLLDVVDICEGGLALNHCLRKVDPCKNAADCPVARKWEEIQDLVTDALGVTTLADIA